MQLVFRFTLAFLVASGTMQAQYCATLYGHVSHRLSDSLHISYNDNRIAYYPTDVYAHIDTSGNFIVDLQFKTYGYYQVEMTHGGKVAETILHPDDNIRIDFDGARFDSGIQYSGSGSAVANFVLQHFRLSGRMNSYSVRLKSAIAKNPSGFLTTIGEYLTNEETFLQDNERLLPASFTKYWRAYFRYYNYFFMQQYPQVHEMITQHRYTDSIPPANFEVIKKMPDSFDDSLLQVPSYLLYLTGIFETRLHAAAYTMHGMNSAQMLLAEDSIYRLGYRSLPPASSEYFVAQSVYNRLRLEDSVRSDSLLLRFTKHWPHSEYLPDLSRQLKIVKRLSKGQPAPDFEFVTDAGKRTKLSELKGSVVYLHFWTSGCRQCVAEMIHEKNIKDKFKGRPVTFVYVSMDNDTSAARLVTSKFGIQGQFTHITGGWAAPEAQLYGVQSLPAYYLIDKKGNFATSHAPADPARLEAEIEALLK